MKKTVFIAALGLFIVAQTSEAAPITFAAILSGAAESPATGSPGTGSTLITVDAAANTLEVAVQFSGLVGTTTASHIHCCTATPGSGNAGVATTTPTFADFPLGVTSGTYDRVLDLTSLTSYNPAFVTANGGTAASAEAALLAGILAGDTYLNIHTNTSPGGEIRGFLVATPEPATWALMLGLLAIPAMRPRRR